VADPSVDDVLVNYKWWTERPMVVGEVLCFCFLVSSFLKHAVSSYFVSSGAILLQRVVDT
jgi:hypothetical protein